MMQPALHITAQVLPGNKIEIQANELSVGDTVEVFMIVSKKSHKSSHSVMDIFNQLPGKRIFKTPEEADQYLQQERNSWEA